MDGERPIVVNSLLCFLHNYRDNPKLDQFLNFFSTETFKIAYQTLMDLIPDKEKPDHMSLLDLLDKVNGYSHAPVFAASDLTVLPLSLNYDRNNKLSKDVFTEIHQLRLIVQNAIDRKDDEVFTSRSSQRSYSTSEQLNVESDEVSVSSVSPTNEFELNTEISSNNQFYVDELLKSSESTEQSVSEPTKKKCEGNRLDQAVRRITDRLGAKMMKEEHSSRPASTTSSRYMDDENMEECPSTPSNNNNNIIIKKEAPTMMTNALSPAAQLIQNSTFLTHLQLSAAAQNPFTQHILQNLARNYQNQLFGQNKSAKSTSERLEESSKTEVTANNQFSPTSSEVSGSKDLDDGQEKPFACNQPNCKKRFANKFLLKKHQFIHTGLRPHECPYCKKQFNRKDNLLRHKKTHMNNGMSPYLGRRRHNMLYGVTQDSALNLNPLPLLGSIMGRHLDANDNEMP